MGHAILEIKNRIYPRVNPVFLFCYLILGFHCGEKDKYGVNYITETRKKPARS